jgi:hypothetical protein
VEASRERLRQRFIGTDIFPNGWAAGRAMTLEQTMNVRWVTGARPCGD